MARTGQVVTGPFTQVTFLETAADTNGERLVMAHRVAPGNAPPPDHLHRRQQETFEVVAGRMWVRVRGEERTLSAGEHVKVPKGTPHTFKNAGAEAMHLRVTLEPALNSKTFFGTIVGLERRGLLPGARITLPQLLQMALLITHYDMPLAGPPLWLQRPVLGVLSAVAQLAGYRAWYPESSAYGEVARQGQPEGERA